MTLGYGEGMTITTDERAAMSALLRDVGPDAPTLCDGWTTRDLLAHLLLRERRPDASGGILFSALAKRTARVQQSIARRPYDEMIDQFAGGPPIWSVWAIPVLGDRINMAEFFIHHEDIRRAQPDWEPRPANPEFEDRVWKSLKTMGRLLYRHSPVGVVLRSANRPDVVAKKSSAAEVVVVGEPSEVLLNGFGRAKDKVRVVVQGSPDDIERFEAAPRGM